MILAAIDIGSNAARLLISEASVYQDDQVDFTKLNLVRVPLRLGFDVFQHGLIHPSKKQALIQTMKAYRLLMDIYQVEIFRACATSALRDAGNKQEIIQAVKKATDISIEIISGQEEASIIYETQIAEKLDAHKSYLYIDVGGGSTEVTLFSNQSIVFKESFNIGTIRILQNQVSDAQWEYMKACIKQAVRGLSPVQAIGSGGNINKVFSLSKKKEGKPLSLELLLDYYQELSHTTIEERKHLYGFRDDRADVIVPALFLYTSIMQWVNATEILVPKIGLADGIIKKLYREST